MYFLLQIRPFVQGSKKRKMYTISIDNPEEANHNETRKAPPLPFEYRPTSQGGGASYRNNN